MIEILTGRGSHDVAALREPSDESLWLTREAFERITGSTLSDEGLCEGETCTPLGSDARARCIDGDAVDAAALWRSLDRPLLSDRSRTLWVLGDGAREREQRLVSGVAPDFELPDLDGTLHRLSDHRGKKVFLTTWSGW